MSEEKLTLDLINKTIEQVSQDKNKVLVFSLDENIGEGLDAYLYCREKINNLKKMVGACFMDIGKYCAAVQDNELWRYEDGVDSFNQWITDPDHGPGIGRRNVFNFMKLYRLGIFLLQQYGIDIIQFVDIGQRKLLYLIPHIQKAIEIGGKDKVEDLLHMGQRLTEEELHHEVSKNAFMKGYGKISVEQPHYIVITNLNILDGSGLLKGKDIQFIIREKKVNVKKERSTYDETGNVSNGKGRSGITGEELAKEGTTGESNGCVPEGVH